MVFVKAGPGDTSDSLIRKFSKKVLQEGILTEIKRREYYVKPSLAKKEKRAEARKRKKFY